MKIGGISVTRRMEAMVQIPAMNGTLVIKVRAFPLDFDVDDLFPWPEAPKIKARRFSGKLERDGDGNVLWERNERDGAYLARRDEVYRARVACMFAKATVRGTGEGEIAFETDVSGDSEEAYRALFDELKEAGFAIGDVNLVLHRARELSSLTDAAIEESKAGFSQAAASPPPASPEA